MADWIVVKAAKAVEPIEGPAKPEPLAPEVQAKVDALSAAYEKAAKGFEDQRTRDTQQLASQKLDSDDRCQRQEKINQDCQQAMIRAYKQYRKALAKLGVKTAADL